MIVFRWLIFLLLIAAIVCFGLYIGTGQTRWRGIGLAILKWTVVAALGFFAVLLLERMVLM
jgi:hypothetical protein